MALNDAISSDMMDEHGLNETPLPAVDGILTPTTSTSANPPLAPNAEEVQEKEHNAPTSDPSAKPIDQSDGNMQAQDGTGEEEDDEEETSSASAFQNVFPTEKLANGFAQARVWWGFGVNKVKAGVQQVNEDPRTMALKERSSEVWGKVVSTSKDQYENLRKASEPMVASVANGASQMSAAIGDKTKAARESVAQSENYQRSKESISNAWSTTTKKVGEGYVTTKEAVGPMLNRLGEGIANVSANVRTSVTTMVSGDDPGAEATSTEPPSHMTV